MLCHLYHMLVSLIALSTAFKKIVSLFIVSMRMCIPWIQSFLLGTVLIQCLEHALYLVGTLKLNIELRNVWLCGGPAGYFCLYHCSILCMCVIEIPFHLFHLASILYHIWETVHYCIGRDMTLILGGYAESSVFCISFLFLTWECNLIWKFWVDINVFGQKMHSSWVLQHNNA